MEVAWVLWYTGAAILAGTAYFLLEWYARAKLSRLPPGPAGLPVLGNLLHMGSMPNVSLFNLSQKYGELMSLRLGFTTTIVVSSPSMAKLFLKNNDHVFAGRSVPHASEALSHCYSSLVFSQCNAHWKMLRRISNTNLFTSNKLDSLRLLRKRQIRRMVSHIHTSAEMEEEVDIGKTVFSCAINVVGNMVFGKDMFGAISEELEEFRETVWELMVIAGTPNLADFFPFLRPFDPQGLQRTSSFYFTKIYSMLDKLIEERLKTTESEEEPSDLLGSLLKARSVDNLSLDVLRCYLTDLFVAGADTVSSTVEWAMAELVKNPVLLKRTQAEIDGAVGVDRMVEESDIDERFEMTRAVLKETMRLHPAVPLLIPRRADEQVEVAGYTIPKHAQVMVNVWAMGRDKSVWSDDAESFMPERFMGSGIDYKGQHFELIPFGSGRRICVGLPLATRMLNLSLASLLHSFDWSLPQSVAPDDLDMCGKFGVTYRLARPLKLLPKPRLQNEALVGISFDT